MPSRGMASTALGQDLPVGGDDAEVGVKRRQLRRETPDP